MSQSHSQQKNRGNALVELVIVVPLLLILPLGVIEVSRLLRVTQVINVASQELAAQIARQCPDMRSTYVNHQTNGYAANPTKLQEKTEACIDEVLPVFAFPTGPHGVLKGEVTVAVSVYRYTGASTAAGASLRRTGFGAAVYPSGSSGGIAAGVTCPGLGGSDETLCSEYKIEDTKRGNLLLLNQASIQVRQRIVVVEMTYKHSPIVGLLNIFREPGGHEYREVTVI